MAVGPSTSAWYSINTRSQYTHCFGLLNIHILLNGVWYIVPLNFSVYTTTYQWHIFHIAASAHCVQWVGLPNSYREPRLQASSLEQDDSAAIPSAWTLSLSSLSAWTRVHQATSLAPPSRLHLAKLRVDVVLSVLNLNKIKVVKRNETTWGLQYTIASTCKQ